MPIKKRQDLYDLFATGNKPTQDDFVDLVDSMINIAEDGIGISEKGRPMEIVEQGSSRRLLDFSSSRDTPIWRINAQSADGNRSGLNISSANRSRFFIRQDNGFTGINNDTPSAKLHISPDNGPALRVDDTANETSFVIEADGRIGIGTEIQEGYRLSVDGKVHLKGETTIDSPVYAEEGIIVQGEKLLSEQGITVRNGAIVETGLLEVKEGLTVNGALSADAGAVIDGLPLETKKGLIVNQGATVETGIFITNAGLEVNGAALTANNGVIVNGAPIDVKNGLIVSEGTTSINGELLANNGLIVDNSTLEANAQVNLGNAYNGTVTANGEFIAKEGIVLENPMFRAVQGITISEGDLNVDHDLIVTGQLVANGGIKINDSVLEATGRVILGETLNGEITANGEFIANNGLTVQTGTLQAQDGAVVTGAELQVEDGLNVKNGVIIENGLLTINEGVFLGNSSEFNANGLVNLGNNSGNGTVTVNGELRMVNGCTVSGEDLQVQSGLLVNGFFNAPNESNLGIASIQTLNVAEINVTGSLGLTTIDLASLRADEASIGTLNTEGDLNVYGRCKVVNNLALAEGRIILTYEGTQTPKIITKKGIISAEPGHFDISIDHDKQVTITYDDSSDLVNFIYDWKTYQYTHPTEAKGFDFRRIGAGSGRLKDEEIELTPSVMAFKEYRVPSNGLRIMYTGTQSGIPQFVIQLRDDGIHTDKFDFIVQDLVLGIFCPTEMEDRTVNNLLASWENWKNINQDLAADFEIRQTGDGDWKLDDLLEAQSLVTTGDVVREYNLGELTVRNTSNVQNQPQLIVAAAAPGFSEEVGLDVSIDALVITLGTAENTPQAVYTAWNNWVKSGNETYGFEIVETANTIPIQVSQEENLVLINDTQSGIEVAGIAVTYTGDEANQAKVILQEGNDDSYLINIDEQQKELVINYPAKISERTISSLLTAWEGVMEKHGFEIYGLGDELYVSQKEAMENILAEIKEFEATTQGVDNITIRYTGPGADTPGVVIKANDTDDFVVSISQDKVITINYPQDKSGNIDELLTYWDGLTQDERDGFSLIKHEIGNAFVDETHGELVENEENKVFCQGIIKTNSVTIEGRLRFGNSNIEISDISNNQSLAEASDTLLTTQKAVKSYVDNGLALKADQSFVTSELDKKANRTYVDTGLAEKANQDFVVEELGKKADQTYVDAELAEKANLTYVDTELAEKADQSFVTEELEKKADRTYVDAELAEKADVTTVATALAGKANMIKPGEFSLGQGATVISEEISLTADYRGVLMVTVTGPGNSKAGLYAVCGMDSIIKIAGGGLSEQQDHADTLNVYTDGGVLTFQNALTDEVVVKATAFGG